jgi:predicted HicB family RNase H-like nuclease
VLALTELQAHVRWENGEEWWHDVLVLTRKRGRPPSTEATGRSVSLSIRMHPLERDAVVTAAANSGLSVADYVRSRILTP